MVTAVDGRKLEVDLLVDEVNWKWVTDERRSYLDSLAAQHAESCFGSKADIPRHSHLCPLLGVKRTSEHLKIAGAARPASERKMFK